jgi:hypothetical protein
MRMTGCRKILLPTIIVASTKVIYRFGIMLLVMCSAIINDGHGSTQKGQMIGIKVSVT